MALLKLLLSFGTIIAVTPLSTCINSKKDLSTAINYRLSDNIKPIHYNIEFILNIEEGIYHGKSNISIEISKATRYIELHSVNVAITETTLINKNVRQSQKNKELFYKSSHNSYDEDTNIFIIYFSDQLLPGNYTLNVEFFGEATNNGLFRTSYINKGRKVWLIATYLQTTGARYLFPCWDEPELKATFTISIKHSKNYRAFSNMPVQRQQKVESNMIWTHFNTTPIMAPNLVGIAVINFISVSHTWNVKIWFREKEAYKLYKDMRHFFTYLTYVYIFSFMMTLQNDWNIMSLKMIPKVDYIAIPDFPEKAAITWGLILFRETDIDDELLLNMTHNKMEALHFIAHNMAQESLNNISPWFTEGFARFLEIYIINESFESYRMMDILVVQLQQESFRLNSYFNESLSEISNSEVNSLPSSLRYHKAFFILRMLQYLLTDEVFRDGIKNFLYTNTKNKITSNDFWIAMQRALDKSNKENKINLIDRQIDSWIKQKNYPILKIRNYGDHINVLLQNSNSFDSELSIPFTYATHITHPNFNKTSLRDVVWLKFTKKNLFSIDIPKNKENDRWIIVNLQQAGYYRVNYDTENWKKIAMYLNSAEYTKIHVLSRAQIIDDAFYFLTTNQISLSVFWEIINYLGRETDYVAWYPMIKAIEHMSSIFSLSDPEIHEIKERMNKIFNELLENIGYEELYEENENYFINYLRQEATKWSCFFDEFKCKKVAGSKLQQHLANRTENKLLSWWEEWTYCNGLMVLDNNVWKDVYNIYMKESDNKYLKFLACSENIVIIKDYGSLMLEGNEMIKDKDRMIGFHYIIAKHAKSNKILDYILANFEKITSRQISAIAVITTLINHVYSQEQLYKIYQFVLEGYVDHIKSHVIHKINRRSSEITNIINYLRKFFSSKEFKFIS